LRQRDLDIAYLDLRDATAAQALDWILLPGRMSWHVEGGKVVAGSARRGAVPIPWVYDVTAIALPEASELAGDHEKKLESAAHLVDEFTTGVSKALGLEAEHVAWYSLGYLAVLAMGDGHARAARLLADLENPGANVAENLAALHKRTAARAAARRDRRAETRSKLDRMRVRQSLRLNSWKLLADAVRGELNREAFQELATAWEAPERAELLASHDVAVYRAAWALNVGARAMPENEELAVLAKKATTVVRDPAIETGKALKESPDDTGLFLAALYGALAQQDDEDLRKMAVEMLTDPVEEGSDTSGLRILANIMFRPQTDGGVDLVAFLNNAEEIRGEDMVALTAMACLRADRETRQQARALRHEILGRQPLPGSLVVWINRLDQAGK
jgi:hypothetical protein